MGGGIDGGAGGRGDGADALFRGEGGIFDTAAGGFPMVAKRGERPPEVRGIAGCTDGDEEDAAAWQVLCDPRLLHRGEKKEEWWKLSVEEKRLICGEASAGGAASRRKGGMIARQFHHCRDLGEPFDFLTWFEYAPEERPAFEEMLGAMRRAPEWEWVEREIELGLVKR